MTRLTKKDGRVLSLAEFTVYAIVFGFSQDGDSLYRGGSRYIVDMLNMSKPTALSHLRALTDEGLIIRIEENINGVDFVNYAVNFDALRNLTGGKESLPGVKNLNGGLNFLTGPGKESLPINISKENNNIDIDASANAAAAGAEAPVSHCLILDVEEEEPSCTLNTKKSAKGATPTTPAAPAARKARAAAPAFDFRAALLCAGVSEEVANEWIKVRKALRAVNSKIAFERVARELTKAAAAGHTADDCIRLAAELSWKGFEAEWMNKHNAFGMPAPATAPSRPVTVKRF